MRKAKPLTWKILVKTKKTMTASGIILTQTEEQASVECYVLEVGKNAFSDIGDGKSQCKVGDLVVISRYSGTLVDMGDKDNVYRIINDKDIHAVYEGEGLDD
jgi:chaperonin GroES